MLEDGHDGALGAVLRHEAAALGVVLDELGDVVAVRVKVRVRDRVRVRVRVKVRVEVR